MDIHRIESTYLCSNMYVLLEHEHAIMIDPCKDYQLPNRAVLDYILLTHEHYDHISGVNYWKNHTNTKVICSSLCGENIRDSKRNLSKYFDVFCQMQTWVEKGESVEAVPYECNADILFTGRMEIPWQGHSFILFETPGHSKGSCCIQMDDQWLFSGDTLMKNYPVSLRLPGGSKKDWLNKSKAVLQKLPGHTVVLPGHFESFQLSEYKFWEAV